MAYLDRRPYGRRLLKQLLDPNEIIRLNRKCDRKQFNQNSSFAPMFFDQGQRAGCIQFRLTRLSTWPAILWDGYRVVFTACHNGVAKGFGSATS